LVHDIGSNPINGVVEVANRGAMIMEEGGSLAQGSKQEHE